MRSPGHARPVAHSPRPRPGAQHDSEGGTGRLKPKLGCGSWVAGACLRAAAYSPGRSLGPCSRAGSSVDSPLRAQERKTFEPEMQLSAYPFRLEQCSYAPGCPLRGVRSASMRTTYPLATTASSTCPSSIQLLGIWWSHPLPGGREVPQEPQCKCFNSCSQSNKPDLT